jgi:hypothetical protein
MTPLGFALTLLFCSAVLFGSRKVALLGIMAAVCYVTQGQQFVVAGVHLTSLRTVLLAGLMRICARGEWKKFALNRVDKSLAAWIIVLVSVSILRQGTAAALNYELGFAYDSLLTYFLFRSLISGLAEFEERLSALAFFLVPFALLMCLEAATAKNLFSAMGGVPEDAWIRDGHVRSMGSFRCPITAGTFGATLAPLFATLFLIVDNRRAAVAGFLVSTVIVLTSRSSGPLMAYFVGMAGLACWPLRGRMQTVRRGAVALLIGLQLVMVSPVWFLIARVCDVIGGGGYYRAHLIDEFIRRWASWSFMGLNYQDTVDWMPTGNLGTGGADITNEFICMGLRGGLLGLILFVLFLVRCFQSLGANMQAARGISFNNERLLWGLGSVLFAHVLNLMSVTYFDQMNVPWFLLLATISAATPSHAAEQAADAAEAPEAAGRAAGAPNLLGAR